jgi:hypothetical protein
MSEPLETPPGTTPPSAPATGAEDPEIGWPRAIITGLAILGVGFLGGVVATNRILTKALGLRRTPREYLATALFFLVVAVLAWALRRMQARKLI